MVELALKLLGFLNNFINASLKRFKYLFVGLQNVPPTTSFEVRQKVKKRLRRAGENELQPVARAPQRAEVGAVSLLFRKT